MRLFEQLVFSVLAHFYALRCVLDIIQVWYDLLDDNERDNRHEHETNKSIFPW